MYYVQALDRFDAAVSTTTHETKEAAAAAFSAAIDGVPNERTDSFVIRPSIRARPIRQHKIDAEPGDPQFNWRGREVFPLPGRPRTKPIPADKPARQFLGVKNRVVSIDDTTAEHAKAIGGGNLSLGLRKAVAAYQLFGNELPDFEA